MSANNKNTWIIVVAAILFIPLLLIATIVLAATFWFFSGSENVLHVSNSNNVQLRDDAPVENVIEYDGNDVYDEAGE